MRGVESSRDVFEYILCGATAVQIGTTLIREGFDCFSRIKDELVAIMYEKGYSSLNDFRGKLNEALETEI